MRGNQRRPARLLLSRRFLTSSFRRATLPALCLRILVALPLMTLVVSTIRAHSRPPNVHPSAARMVTDETGRTIAWPAHVERIVSLAPSVTETLFALGLGDRVVGDTTYCDYPPAAKSKTHVGGPIDPSIEAIAALHPDLVIATRSINRQTTVNSLERLGLAVYATDPHTVEQVLESTERLGHLIRANDTDPAPGAAALAGAGHGNPGVDLVMDLRRRLATVRTKLSGAQPKTAFFIVWQTPLITVGHNTFLADALRYAGARSALELPQDWPNVSLESVVRAQPEYLIFSSDDRAQALHQVDELRNQPGWRDLHAMRDRRIVILPESISHPSPRLIDAIEELARALYPDRFALYGAPAPAPAENTFSRAATGAATHAATRPAATACPTAPGTTAPGIAAPGAAPVCVAASVIAQRRWSAAFARTL
jgi:iron complex transport system substrate-binding protein